MVVNDLIVGVSIYPITPTGVPDGKFGCWSESGIGEIKTAPYFSLVIRK